jgi:hypothetical protein
MYHLCPGCEVETFGERLCPDCQIAFTDRANGSDARTEREPETAAPMDRQMPFELSQNLWAWSRLIGQRKGSADAWTTRQVTLN